MTEKGWQSAVGSKWFLQIPAGRGGQGHSGAQWRLVGFTAGEGALEELGHTGTWSVF